jgi:hypothetical protein
MKNTHVGGVVNKVNSFLGDTHVCRVRMHYGHSDVFDRLFHISRGGISKASKQINLSGDIFTGLKRELLAQCFLVKTQILSSKEKHLELGVEFFLLSLCEFLEASLLPQPFMYMCKTRIYSLCQYKSVQNTSIDHDKSRF